MSRAETTLSRRSAIVGLAAALPAAAAVPASSAAADPDAELLRLGQEWRAAYEHAEACGGADFDAAVEARWQLEKQILAIAAAGVAGLGVKASMVERFGIGEAQYIEEAFLADVLRLSGQLA